MNIASLFASSNAEAVIDGESTTDLRVKTRILFALLCWMLYTLFKQKYN